MRYYKYEIGEINEFRPHIFIEIINYMTKMFHGKLLPKFSMGLLSCLVESNAT